MKRFAKSEATLQSEEKERLRKVLFGLGMLECTATQWS